MYSGEGSCRFVKQRTPKRCAKNPKGREQTDVLAMDVSKAFDKAGRIWLMRIFLISRNQTVQLDS